MTTGGGAKSLKVVSESHWLAEVCILSRACAICSRSAVVEMEATEPRRARALMGEPIEADVGEPGSGLDAVLLDITESIRDAISSPVCRDRARKACRSGTHGRNMVVYDRIL